ncbi:MAG: hypothetical protein ACPGQL_02270 [Thermoplasmatota archaeon]
MADAPDLEAAPEATPEDLLWVEQAMAAMEGIRDTCIEMAVQGWAIARDVAGDLQERFPEVVREARKQWDDLRGLWDDFVKR